MGSPIFEKNIYRDYLLGNGVKKEQIITIELHLVKDIRFRNPLVLASHVREMVENKPEEYYLFVDEIQMSGKIPKPYNPPV